MEITFEMVFYKNYLHTCGHYPVLTKQQLRLDFCEHIYTYIYLHIHALNQMVSTLKNNIDKMNQLSSLPIFSWVIQKKRDFSQLCEQPVLCLCSGHVQAKALHTATIHAHTPVAPPVCEWGSSSHVNREGVVRVVRSYEPFLPDGPGVSWGTREGSPFTITAASAWQAQYWRCCIFHSLFWWQAEEVFPRLLVGLLWDENALLADGEP